MGKYKSGAPQVAPIKIVNKEGRLKTSLFIIYYK